MNISCCFVVAPVGNGLYAAVTRPEGGIGLPGGMAEPGENIRDAAIREANEKGWFPIGTSRHPFTWIKKPEIHIFWFKAQDMRPLDEYKEKPRIRPIAVGLQLIRESGKSNDHAVASMLQEIKPCLYGQHD